VSALGNHDLPGKSYLAQSTGKRSCAWEATFGFLLTLPDQANVNIEMQLFRLALLYQIGIGIRVPLLID